MRGALFAGGTTVAFGFFVFACSLGLDESLIDKKDAAVTPTIDANLPDGTIVTESGVPETPNGQACKVDTDCVAANACLTGTCDQSRGTCAYNVCRPAACQVGVCDQSKKTCSAPAAYKELAAQFALPAPVQGGVIAAYPWLFVSTLLGVFAYNVGNVALVNPATVPITGLGFVPFSMTRSGNRIWLNGQSYSPPNVTGSSALPIAYIDIPADPFTTSIAANTHVIAYNRPAESEGVLARDGQTALLFSGVATNPSSVLTAPFTDPVSLTATPLTIPMGFGLVSMSGTRLLLSSVTDGSASFQFINGAGSATPTNGSTVTIADAAIAGNASGGRTFAQATDGTVFWLTGVNNPAAGQPPVVSTTNRVRGYFLVADGKSEISAGVSGVDIEVFANADDTTTVGAGGGVGPVGLLDNATALVTTASKDAPGTTTAVQFVKRTPLAVSARTTIPTAIGNVRGVTGSNGLGYIAVNEPGAVPATDPQTGHIYVLDLACPP